MNIRLVMLTLLALVAFSGNSLLCRLALKETSIDPATFMTLRIASGALVLGLLLSFQERRFQNPLHAMQGSWKAAFALFVYALAFAYAYTGLSAGTGALLLFASIQITMILVGLVIGERLALLQWLGVLLAISGLVALLLPHASAPAGVQGGLMLISGMAWGAFSLLGRGAKDPVHAIAGNFIRATPMALVFFMVVCVCFDVSFDSLGVQYALASGALTSGLGYILWYAALKHLKVMHAATVQLSVPVLTSFAGVLLLNEPVTPVLMLATVLIVLGVGLVVLMKRG